jgi:hypothetical protein
MRGKIVGVWSLTVLVVALLYVHNPVRASSTASVMVTVAVRPPKVSLDIRARAPNGNLPTRFGAISSPRLNNFNAPDKVNSQAIAAIMGVNA